MKTLVEELGLKPGEVFVTTVSLSHPAVKLSVLDSVRQRDYGRLAAEQYKLEQLLNQVAAQKLVVDQCMADYKRTVNDMSAVANRNQPPLTYSH